jgi:putative dehydrogenase
MDRPNIAIVAAGEMGAGLGARLSARGLPVRTSLTGRSAATAQRAARAGMANAADDAELVDVAYFLSVVPPGDAIGLAERLRDVLAAASRKPVYIDCNAIAPRTAQRVAEIVTATGCTYVDAGIVGGPPVTGDDAGPRIYLSGERAAQACELRAFGIDVRDLAAPAGAASALKLAYAGVTKGLQAIGAATRAAAEANGVAAALRAEVLASQPELTAWLDRALPRMPPKAYRWVDEMEEIAAYLGDDGAGAAMYDGMARFYERIARSVEPVPLG